MESSTGLGVMAVVAVSGSVAFMALQIHKHLVAEFMKKVESELGGLIEYREITIAVPSIGKKKVRFAEDVVEPKSNNKEYRKRGSSGGGGGGGGSVSVCVNNRVRTAAINGGA
ncbi:hypothetical protein Syun_002373 [Stephania yunnanensis]|uniref:Uncharacterized protein n=1 Tax=Stephania yunnanensis TaxID=152371 RepID=A0AAP0LFC3_9MAGN